MTVVVLTCSDDVWVPDVVVAAVARRGGRALRVDSDRFPGAGVALSVEDDGGWHLRVDGTSIEVDGLWARRRWAGLGVLEGHKDGAAAVDARFASGAAAQGRALLHAWLRALPGRGGAAGIRVVNDVDAEDRAEDKVLQLRLARALGFALPETLISNEPARVRAFVDDVRSRGGRVVTKLLVPLVQRMQGPLGPGPGDFFYTADVDDDDLADDLADDVAPGAGALASLVHAPQIFQRKIDKRLELRVQVVGDDVFCGALPALARDWRLQQTGAWQKHALSPTTTERCLRLCRELGLVTGAIDLLVDSRSDEHFLELNPAGEWGFLERDLGFPIGDAIAAQLVRGSFS